jgi:peptidylglycine monooxygenase
MARTELVVGLGEELFSIERPWGELPPDVAISDVSDVAVDSRDRVYVFQRADPPIIIFESDGTFAGAWGTGQLADAHGIFITPDDRVLLCDRDAHQVLCFDLDGNLLLALGERHRPSFQAPFNHPADAATTPDGDIVVADGYANSVVHRFSPGGELLQSWGGPGTGPGTFTTPHAVRVHPDGRILVADRENDRVQVFSPSGEYLTSWGDFYHPMDIFIDRRGRTYVTDQIPRLSLLDVNGTLIGRCRPVLYQPHGVWGDSAGNLYIAEPAPMNRVTRLTRLPAS